MRENEDLGSVGMWGEWTRHALWVTAFGAFLVLPLITTIFISWPNAAFQLL